MRKISTGEPSTLRTYISIAKFLGREVAVKFLEEKAKLSPNGLDEEVITPESQMLNLIVTMKEEV